jgi:hypothetical protein
MNTLAMLLGMVLMAGQAIGQGQSLDQLIQNGVVVPPDKGPSRPRPAVPHPGPAAGRGGAATNKIIMDTYANRQRTLGRAGRPIAELEQIR